MHNSFIIRSFPFNERGPKGGPSMYRIDRRHVSRAHHVLSYAHGKLSWDEDPREVPRFRSQTRREPRTSNSLVLSRLIFAMLSPDEPCTANEQSILDWWDLLRRPCESCSHLGTTLFAGLLGLRAFTVVDSFCGILGLSVSLFESGTFVTSKVERSFTGINHLELLNIFWNLLLNLIFIDYLWLSYIDTTINQ